MDNCLSNLAICLGINAEGHMVVDFATRMEMAVLNTYFKEREEHRLT